MGIRGNLAIMAFVGVSLLFSSKASSQNVGLHTNALYWATTTPNLGAEVRLSAHYTLSATVGYNAFKFGGRADDSPNSKIHHWALMPELKYRFCRPYERSYVGLHTLYADYNMGGISFIRFLRHHRYKGWGTGAGFSAGYQWPLSRRWGLEASLGLGYLYLEYDKFNCERCGKKLTHGKRHYVGPTKAALSLIYYIQ